MAKDKLDLIIADIEQHQERTGDPTEVASRELRTELSDNLWPLFRSFALEVKERLELHDEGFAELARREESFIQPELAGDILGALTYAQKICIGFANVLEKGELPDEATTKALITEIREYLGEVRQLAEEVGSVTVELEDPEDYDEGDEAEGDDDEPAESGAPGFEYEIEGEEGDDEPADDGEEDSDDEER